MAAGGPQSRAATPPAAAEPLCPDTDVGREAGVAAPPAGRSWAREASENAGWGWGGPAGTRAPRPPSPRRFQPSLSPTLTPVARGRGCAEMARGSVSAAREREAGAARGGNFVSHFSREVQGPVFT